MGMVRDIQDALMQIESIAASQEQSNITLRALVNGLKQSIPQIASEAQAAAVVKVRDEIDQAINALNNLDDDLDNLKGSLSDANEYRDQCSDHKDEVELHLNRAVKS